MKPPARKPSDNEWIAKIDGWQSSPKLKDWREACDAIEKRYLYEGSKTVKTRQYQLLWSNMETMKGATYSKPPKAEVIRRYYDKDQTARQATIMVERGINYTIDANSFDVGFRQVRDDYLLFARGVARVVYEAETGPAEIEPDADPDADPQEILKFEHVKIKYVHREDFAHEPARTWEEVKRVAFRSFMDRAALVKRFGKKIGDAIQLDVQSDRPDGKTERQDTAEPKAAIWEVWDREGDRVLWVAVGHPDVLEESEPYLDVDGFFPCPRPAYGTLTNASLAPRPDYVYYQDQAEEINNLTARIASLQDSLKIVGFYPAGAKGEGIPEIEKAVRPGVENRMIAVTGWENFASKGGGKAPIVFLPVQEVAEVLKACVELRKQLIDDVHQIYGLSDIMRGQGDADATAKAEGIKAQYGSLRIRSRQGELARFCRDVCRLVGDVICNHFQPETIMAMSNQPLPTDQEVLAQLQQQQMMMQQQAAMQQQSPMLGHNGGPPMGAPPQGQPQPGMMQ